MLLLTHYHMVLLPFRYTMGESYFTEGVRLFLDVFDYVIKGVYFMDVILGFRKAFLNSHYLEETDPCLIACRYLRFYFWVDLMASIPFETFISHPAIRFLSLSKMFRLMRMNKVISFMRLEGR